MYLNSVQIIGLIGKDPERRQACVDSPGGEDYHAPPDS